MDFVIDASIVLSWCFSDEATPETSLLLKQIKIAYAPALWSLEVGNALLTAIRRKRLTHAEAVNFLSLLNKLNIQIDLDMATRGTHDIFLLAHSEGLTTYDAAYLDLAMQRALPLATRDKALALAAKRLGVTVI